MGIVEGAYFLCTLVCNTQLDINLFNSCLVSSLRKLSEVIVLPPCNASNHDPIFWGHFPILFLPNTKPEHPSLGSPSSHITGYGGSSSRGGYDKDKDASRSGGYDKDSSRSGGYDKDSSRSGGYDKDSSRSGGYDRDRREERPKYDQDRFHVALVGHYMCMHLQHLIIDFMHA